MFRSLKKLGIRSWMLFGTTLAILPLLGFAAWIVVALVMKEHADDDRELLQRSQVASLALKHRFDRAAAALEVLAASPSLQRGDLHGLYDEAKTVMARHPDATAISIVRANGEVLFSTAAAWGETLDGSKAVDLEQPVFSNGDTVYTRMFPGSVTHHWVMAVSVPARVDGEVKYSLRMTLPSEALSAVLKEQVLPQEWTSAFIDPAGVIAGRSSDAAKLVGRPATQTLRQAITTGASCPYRTTTYDGAQLSSCAYRVPDSDWFAAIGVPTGAYEHDLRDSLTKLMAAGLASSALGIFGALLIANAIKDQVKSLTAVSTNLDDASGHAAPSSPTIRELAHAARGIQASRRRAGELEGLLVQARHDSLTGLPGRELFWELVAGDLASADSQGDCIALLFLDLDGFKSVNDRQGHDAGDALLRQVADIIRAVVRANDIPARLGGDEFVIYLRADAAEVERASAFVAQRLLSRIEVLGEIGCSIGIAVGACNASLLEGLLWQADQAMLSAKMAGKARYVFSQPPDRAD